MELQNLETVHINASGTPWIGFDVELSPTAGETAFDFSYDAGTLALHTLPPGPENDLTTSIFRPDFGAGVSGPVTLIRRDNGSTIPPAESGVITLDANDVLLDADHLVMPNGSTVRIIPTRPITIDPSSPQNIDLTFYVDNGSPQTTISTGPGDIQADLALLPNGDILGGVASDTDLSLFVFDPVNHSFVPTSTITANDVFHAPYILQRNESNLYFMSIVDGQTIRSFSVDASSVTPGPTHVIPVGAIGAFIAADSAGSPLFTYVQNNTIFRGDIGSSPHTTIQFGNVNQTLNATTPAGSPTSFESVNGDVTVTIAQGFVPFSDDTFRVNAAGDARVIAHDLQHDVDAVGSRAGVLRSVAAGQTLQADTTATGRSAVALAVDASMVPAGAFDPLVDFPAVLEDLNPDAAARNIFNPHHAWHLGLMDTTRAAPGQRVATKVVGGTEAAADKFDLASAGIFVASVISHADGSQTLDARHSIGDFDGDDENDASTTAAVSEDGHALLTSDTLLPTVQQFRADAEAASGDELEVLSFVDVDLETDDRMRATIELTFPDPAGSTAAGPQPALQADHLVISEVGYDTPEASVGSSSSAEFLEVQLSYMLINGTGGGPLLTLSGTPAVVAAQLNGLSLRFATLLPPLPVTDLNLVLTYDLTSLDGSTATFSHTSGLVEIVPEPASLVLILVAAVGLARRRLS